GLPVVRLGELRLELIVVSRDVTKQVEGMGCDAEKTWKGLDGVISQTPCFVDSAEQQVGAREPNSQHVAGYPSLPAMLAELLAFTHSRQRLAQVAEVSQRQGRGRDDLATHEKYIPLLEHRDRVVHQGVRLGPVALDKMHSARGEIGETNRV